MQIGVDFGGTKIEAAALNLAGEFIARVRAPNPGSYEAAIQTVCALVSEVESIARGTGTVGIAVPGSISPTSGVMRNANSVYLNGRNLNDDFCAALQRPIRMANDANCLALSEALDGAARDSTIVFAAILGTGCGGGLVVNGTLIEGAHGIAGEWGHVPLPPAPDDAVEQPLCWCGQRGCLETWISGSGLQRDYAATHGTSLASEEIVSLMRGGDARACATVERYLHRLGRALAMVCNIVDPDTIVLGGGLSNVTELYSALPPIVRSHVFSDAWNAKLVPARWGDSSGVRGAARLWPAPTTIDAGHTSQRSAT
jgi:fructokinase